MASVLRATAIATLLSLSVLATSGCSYNRFVGQEEAIETQWAQVENQLQRRNDLIPNLVETTKGFAQLEKDVFTAVAASREKLAGARTPEETAVAIAAEIIALSWNGSGRRLTDLASPIHR